MKVIALDASVAAKWYLNENGRDLALRLLEDTDLQFVAPDIFHPEVVNALLRQNRGGHLPDDLLQRASLDLWATLPQLIPTSRIVERATEIAQAIRHPVYDCLYLSLAERWSTSLVTADEEFAQRCRTRLADAALSGRICTLQEFYTS